MKSSIAWILCFVPAAAFAEDGPPVEVDVAEESDELYPSAGDGPRDRSAEERALEDDADRARGRLEARTERRAEDDCDGHGPWFWHKPTGARRGDFLLTWRGGVGASGGFGGGSLEWLLGERLGLRLGGLFDAVGGDREIATRANGWAFASGAWAGLDADRFQHTDRGLVGLVEPSVVYHLRPGARLDLYATLGAAAFFYRLDEQSGGSALLRTGVGAQYFWKALFVGAELGWYPIELARVHGQREGNRDVYRVDQPEDRFDPRRATFVAHVGLRL